SGSTFDHFGVNAGYSFGGDLSLGQGLSLSGTLSVAYSTGVSLTDPLGATQPFDVWKIGIENGTGYLGLDKADPGKPGLSVTDVDAGVLIVDASTPGTDLGWLLAKGTAAAANVSINSSIAVNAGSLAVDFSLGLGTLGASANDSGLNLSAQAQSITAGATTFTFDGDGSLGEFAALSGTATVTAGPFSLTGTVGLAVSAGSLTMAGTGITGGLVTSGLSVGVSNAAFGLLVTPANTFALEASGGISFTGGSFANLSATSTTVQFNNTGCCRTACWWRARFSTSSTTWRPPPPRRSASSACRRWWPTPSR
ncbi:hypothetical protein LDC_2904, partial [sediment metagenome]